jgi:hypothetical protein
MVFGLDLVLLVVGLENIVNLVRCDAHSPLPMLITSFFESESPWENFRHIRSRGQGAL